MKKVKYFSCLLFFLASFPGILGCGAAPEEVKSPPPPSAPFDDDLYDLVPAMSDTVVRIDVAAARASTLFETLKNILESDQVNLIEKPKVLGLMLGADELLMAYAFGEVEDADQFAVLIKGAASTKEALGAFDTNAQAQSVQMGDFNGIRTPRLILLALTERTLVFGTESMIEAVVDLASGEGESLKKSRRDVNLSLADGTSARFAYRRQQTIPPYVVYWADAVSVDPEIITGLDGYLSLEQGLEIGITLLLDNETEALAAASELEQIRKSLGGNMFVALLGLDWLLDRVEVVKQASSASLSAKLDARDLQELLRLLDRFKRLEDLMNANNGGAPPMQAEPEEGDGE